MSASFGDILFDDGRHTAAFDGESFTGHAFHALVQREARHFSSTIYYSERSPTFRADNGFEPSNDQRKVEAEANYWSYPTRGLLTGWAPEINLYRQWDFDGERKVEHISLELDGNLRLAQLNLAIAAVWGNERYKGIWFSDVWQSAIAVNARPNDMMALGAEFRYGHQIARGPRLMGREITFEPSIDLKLNHRMLLENGLQYAQSHNLDTDARLYRQSVVRSRLTYQFTRRLSARAVVQYDESRDWTDSSASRNWQVDPLLTYRLNSFSVVYLGSTHSYDDLSAKIDDSEIPKSDWALTSRQYFLKLQYLFQL